MTSPRQAIDYQAQSLGQLAALVQAGQQQPFRHIIERCNQRLFRVARAVLNDDDEAEDALQEAWIKAYQHMGSFRGDAQLTTWLTRIVLNECYGRRRKRRPTVGLEHLETAAGNSSVVNFPTRPGMDDPASNAAAKQLRRLIEQAVASLPQPYRLVFVLRDIEQCSTEETARTLGIRQATVKTRLFRARRQLREALKDKLATPLEQAYPFLGSRCAGLTDRVMRRINQLPTPH